MGTGVSPPLQPPETWKTRTEPTVPHLPGQGLAVRTFVQQKILGQASRPISTGKLHPLPNLHILPINLVVSEGSSVPIAREGDLILGRASRLYAFSVYLCRT